MRQNYVVVIDADFDLRKCFRYSNSVVGLAQIEKRPTDAVAVAAQIYRRDASQFFEFTRMLFAQILWLRKFRHQRPRCDEMARKAISIRTHLDRRQSIVD